MTRQDISVICESDINRKMIDVFLKDNRGMLEDTPRNALTDIMIERGCFYVPFANYFEKVYGYPVRMLFDKYFLQGKCSLVGAMCVPLETVNGRLIGFVANNPSEKAVAKYVYPSAPDFFNSRYIQMVEATFKKALNEQYVILVEGVYDELSVSACGLSCWGLCGSTLTRGLATIINLVPTKIVLSDEDKAGRKIFLSCQEKLEGKVISVKLPTKDIDQFLRSQKNREKFIDVMTRERNLGWPNLLIKLGE